MWASKKRQNEVHPLLLTKTKHVNFAIHATVKEYRVKEEHHPSAVYKITVPPEKEKEEDDSSLVLHTEEEWSKHFIITSLDDSCSESSTIYTEEGDDLEREDYFEVQTEREQSNSEIIDSRLTGLDDKAEACQDLSSEKKAITALRKKKSVKDDSSSPSKAKSIKIKWSVKRKRKRKMCLRVPVRPRKVVLLGDTKSGKSNLITTYCHDRFMNEHQETILNCCLSDAKAFGRDIELILVDTSGQKEFKKLRQCAYENTDVVVLCYSAGNRETLENLKSYWIKEAKESLSGCPMIVVETQRDIREEYEDKKKQMEKDGLTESDEYNRVCQELEDNIVPDGLGMKLAKILRVDGFYSSSARYRVGTRTLFQGAAKVALRKSRRERKW